MPSLQCRISSDLLPWEHDYFEAFLKAIETRCEVHRDIQPGRGPAWVVARDARAELDKLPRGFKEPVHVSVLMAQHATRWFGIFSKSRRPSGLNVRWLAHSDFAFRFLKEMERIDPQTISCIPLPGLLAEKPLPLTGQPLRVGVLTALNADANLSFLVSVAHYVSRLSPEIRFSVPAAGKLSEHLTLMAKDLGLGTMFETVQSTHSPDMVMFAPLKTEHFAGVLWAGSRGIPVLASDVTGIASLISDGQDGFILPVNEVKPVAELILRLAHDRTLRTALGDRLRQSLAKRLPLDRLLSHFYACFFEPAASVVHVAA